MKRLLLIVTALFLILTGCSEKPGQAPTTGKEKQPPRKQIVIEKETSTELPFSPSNQQLSKHWGDFEAVPLATGGYLINVYPHLGIIKDKDIRFVEANQTLHLKDTGYVTYNNIIYSGTFAIDDRNGDFKCVNNLAKSYREVQISPDTSIKLEREGNVGFFNDTYKLILQKIPSCEVINEFEIENGYEPGDWKSTLYPAPGTRYLGHISGKITDGSQPINMRLKDLETSKVYNFTFVEVPYQDDFKIYGLAADKNNVIWVAYNVKADSLKTELYNHNYLQAYRYNSEKDAFDLIDRKELPGEHNYTIYPAGDGVEILWITEEKKNPQLEQWSYYFHKTSASIDLK